jgi:spore germination protein KB
MEKKSYISTAQIVLVLFITRLLFSSTYMSVLKTGNYIQDTLFSIPIIFIVNFITAIPLLMLLKRHPGHNPVECTMKIAGKGVGSIVAVFYYLFFLLNAAVVTGNYENYFSATMIPDVNSFLVGFIVLIVCLYGVLKGIETIARFGSIVAIIYMITLIIIFISLEPMMDLDTLKPVFYTGTSYLMSSSIMNYNLSIQILAFAFLAPYMRQGGSLGKAYAGWNLLTSIILFMLMFYIVTVTGSFGAEQMYPLQTLATLTKISSFERLDAIHMVSWILNTIITITLYIYLAISCLLKTGLNKHRRVLALVSGVAVFFVATFLSRNFNFLQVVIDSGEFSIAITFFIIIIPLIVLMADVIKGRVMQDAKNE